MVVTECIYNVEVLCMSDVFFVDRLIYDVYVFKLIHLYICSSVVLLVLSHVLIGDFVCIWNFMSSEFIVVDVVYLLFA